MGLPRELVYVVGPTGFLWCVSFGVAVPGGLGCMGFCAVGQLPRGDVGLAVGGVLAGWAGGVL